MKKKISVDAAAKRMGVHRNTIISWIVAGKLPATRRGPFRKSPYAINTEDLEKLAAGIEQ